MAQGARLGPDRQCTQPGCGRPRYALGYCQTHYRQWKMAGKTGPIRLYRRRGGETVKFAGFRVSPRCAQALEQRARRDGLSESATIVEVLKEWFQAREK